MLRSVIAQYYRRGKSLGRRDFSSSRDVVGLAGSVMETLLPYGVGLGFGTGSAALLFHIFGLQTSGEAEEIEKFWETKQLELEQIERDFEEKKVFYGEMIKRIAEAKDELKRAKDRQG